VLLAQTWCLAGRGNQQSSAFPVYDSQQAKGFAAT